MKLIRNTLASKEILLDGANRPIKWSFIENLILLQKNSGMHFANKVNLKHMDWRKNIMSVKLAAQTLSESTATSLEYLSSQQHQNFLDAEATIDFIKRINNIFDCLNSRSRFAFELRSALIENNSNEIFNYFEESIQYFENIKLQNGNKIRYSLNKTGFIGLIIAIKNLKKLYKEYVIEKKLFNIDIQILERPFGSVILIKKINGRF